MRAVTVATFRDDPLFPKISRVVANILEKDKVVRPIDVLIGMQLLSRDDLEEWRCGRVPYLEKVIDCNLTRLSRLLRILQFHAHDLNLVPSDAAYIRPDRGQKGVYALPRPAMPNLKKPTPCILLGPGKDRGTRPASNRPELTRSQILPDRAH
jgi:hypothetical protein